MKEKIAIIGIDSLDPKVITKYSVELPNFNKIMSNSPTLKVKSVFPTDTIPAWASIFSGLDPSNHGFMYVYDVFDPNLSDLSKLDINILKGRSVFDYIAEAGFKSLVFYPILFYPPWDINGIMISKSPFDVRIDSINTRIDLRSMPEDILEKNNLPTEIMSIWGGHPGKERLYEWSRQGQKSLTTEYSIAKKIFSTESWEFLFMYFSLLDIIQHRLWRFFDPEDPTYPGSSDLEHVILDYYKQIDSIIGDFINEYPDVPLVIVSDHGHTIRPYKTININKMLLDKGYLKVHSNSAAKGNVKKYALSIIRRFELENYAMKLLSKSKGLTKIGKSIYSSEHLIDKTSSSAFLSTFAGIKSYPFGGIQINPDVVSPQNYDEFRKKMVKELSDTCGADGNLIFEWIIPREDLYQGKYVAELYPDVVFRLKQGFGVGWDITNEEGEAHDHTIASGGHDLNGVLLLRNIPRPVRKNQITLEDFTPTVLDILGIELPDPKFDGRSIFDEA